jgi:hypothetical protein
MRQKSVPEKAPAEQVVKDIRRATRRQFSAEEKIRIVLEGVRGEESISSRVTALDTVPADNPRSFAAAAKDLRSATLAKTAHASKSGIPLRMEIVSFNYCRFFSNKWSYVEGGFASGEGCGDG